MNNNLLNSFQRGFLLTDKKVALLENKWERVSFERMHLQYDPKNEVSNASYEDSYVVILGRVVNILTGNFDLDSISKNLLVLLNNNVDSFFEQLESLNGRFVVFYKTKGSSLNILNDACGLRSVFYSVGESVVVGSHPSMVARTIGADRNQSHIYLSKYSAYHLPGNITLWDGVKQLVPNHYYDTSCKRLVRFFPTKPLEVDTNSESLRKEQAGYLRKQVEALNVNNNLLLSITAGIDSRVTLAASRTCSKDIRYFTYIPNKKTSNEILKTDHEVVTSIVENLNLTHQFFPIPDSDSAGVSELRNKLLVESHVSFNAAIAKEYHDRFSGGEFLHIRSNLLEIGRFFYRDAYNIKETNMSLSTAVNCYSPKAINDVDIQKIFSDFLSEVNYEDIPDGYDPYDLFYWEYRMGIWHSMVLLESDASFDTHVLFNSRLFLNAILSIPGHIRSNDKFYLDMCEDSWPILNYWGVNENINVGQVFDSLIHSPVGSIRLDTAKVLSGGGKQTNYNSVVKRNSAYFHLADSAPEKGDFVLLQLHILHKDIGSKAITINYRTPRGVPSCPGRLEVVISINGNEIHRQDVGKKKTLNQIEIPSELSQEDVELSIGVEAVRNCESWSWGKAGLVVIERISLI